MPKRLYALLLGLLTTGLVCSVAAGLTTSQPATVQFSADSYQADVKYLASDELAGRRPGTPGIELAAEYIAKQFAAAGLTPAGDDGTWFQKFEVQRGKKLTDADALLKVDGVDHVWQVRKDWIPLPFSGTEDVEGPLAFAGYGIKATAYGYNDYADFDAKGKILLVFRYEPRAEDPNVDFGGQTPSRHALFQRKAQVAQQAGALALVIVNPQRDDAEDTLYPFDEEFTAQTYDLPVVHVTRALAETLVKQAGLGTLAELQEKLDGQREPLSADMHLHVQLKTGVKANMIETRNVLGMLKGDGSTDETIVVGAHYDHLGNVPQQFDRSDDRLHIHYGADDNASGTAGVIELARVMGHERGLRRNVLFMTFSGEEMGLLGSEHFVKHPTIDLQNVRAMVNFDMIGRLNLDKFTVFGVDTGSGFSELVSRAAEETGLKYRAAKGVPRDSDHASFHDHEIPVLFAFTGLHKDYHRPSDTWDKIDAQGATRVLTMFYIVVRELADMSAGPTFEVTAPETEIEPPAPQPDSQPSNANTASGATPEQPDQGEHPERRRGADVDRPSRPTVRLGIVPDYTSGDEPGVVAEAVIDGGPAKAAGMQAGDRIIRVGEQNVKDVYGYLAALKAFKAGDTAEVVVVRKQKETTLKIKLEAMRRPRGRD